MKGERFQGPACRRAVERRWRKADGELRGKKFHSGKAGSFAPGGPEESAAGRMKKNPPAPCAGGFSWGPPCPGPDAGLRRGFGPSPARPPRGFPDLRFPASGSPVDGVCPSSRPSVIVVAPVKRLAPLITFLDLGPLSVFDSSSAPGPERPDQSRWSERLAVLVALVESSTLTFPSRPLLHFHPSAECRRHSTEIACCSVA